MQLGTLGLLITTIILVAAGLIWLIIAFDSSRRRRKQGVGLAAAHKQKSHVVTELAKSEAEHIFDDQFREELKNHGRLYFEKIISENAMFLQQDLRLTTSQLNDFMKQEITRTLQEEFSKYERSITDAKQLAIESLNKTRQAIEQQRQILAEQIERELKVEKERLVARFENNLAEIVNHYVVAAIGNQIDLSDQLEYILGELEANKQAIAEDIKNGA